MEYSKLNGQIRLCAWESHSGVRRPYLCRHHEYCCALGCCVSSAFSFYQLWYFWLLLLLIILLCSGGGWWFRFRHGGFSRQGTPEVGRGRRHRRRGVHGAAGQRVYPNQYYGPTHQAYNLPPGYDKDPPSYNEVISHINQFPRIEDMRPGDPMANDGGVNTVSGNTDAATDTNNTANSQGVHAAAPQDDATDCHMSIPPPTYEMVLDLKRQEVHVQDVEDQQEGDGITTEDSISNTRERIRNLLGRIRPGRTSLDPTSAAPPPPFGLVAASSSTSSTSSSPSTPSSGLFTISRESLPSPEYSERPPPPPPDEPPPPSFHAERMPPPSDSETSSHSDYSSSFISSPSHSSSSMSLSVAALQASNEASTSGSSPSADGHGGMLGVEHTGASRPCTGRSTLSRPTTSISARTLPPPPELARKTSLPGTVVEVEDNRVDAR